MKVFENVPLSEIVFYQIGGKSRFVIQVDNAEDTVEAIRFCRKNKIEKILVIGLGSNVIIPDQDFNGAVIWMKGAENSHEVVSENKVRCFAGESVDSLIKFIFSNNLIGIEWAGGLPSTVGGAIRGNAGAFGFEIKDSVKEIEIVDLLDPELEVKKYTNEQAEFSYRNSYFKQNPNLIVLSATFQLQKGSDEELQKAKEVYHANINYRNSHHPVEYPSCGSVFKNITKKEEVEKILSVWEDVRSLSEQKWHNKVSMGYIINRLGFSGKRIGGAEVSTKHTNYISNIDNAKAEDVKALIREVQAKFTETFGFTPEPEVIIL